LLERGSKERREDARQERIDSLAGCGTKPLPEGRGLKARTCAHKQWIAQLLSQFGQRMAYGGLRQLKAVCDCRNITQAKQLREEPHLGEVQVRNMHGVHILHATHLIARV